MVANDGNAAVSLFGLESRADDDRLLTRPNELSQSRKRYEKALEKGLQNAKAQVDQFYQEDNKFPDLYDRLLNQTEPQNYFFEPYVTQWRPQIVKKGSLVTYPSVVASSIEETKTLTLSGLLEEISHAWTSVDNRLFVWNYRNLKQFAALEFDQAIVAVSLCESPASGIFTEKVQHLLVVATTVNISLVAVLFDPFVSPGSSAGSTSLAPKLQRTKLGVSTDNCVVRSIVCTQHGRIFFGGSDGTLYELCYGPEGTSTPVKGLLPSFFTSSDATPRCSKVAHTTNYSNYLPSFLVGFAGSLDKIHQIALDSERNVLYVLHDQAHVEVFDLGHNAKDLKLVCSLNLLSAGTKYAREYRRTRVSCPDEKLFQKASTGDATTTDPVKFIYICPVPRNESLFITLLAVTSNGLRCYLTVYSKSTYIASALGSRADNEKASIVQNKRPTRLEMVYIRLPPPAVDVNDSPPYHTKEGMQPGFVPGKSPSQIHSAYYRDGVFLIANGGKDKQDQFIGIAYDAIATTLKSIHKPAIRESISLDNTLGKVIEIKGFGVNQRKISSVSSAAGSNDGISSGSKRSFDTMAKAGKSTSGNEVIIGEMTSQFSEPPRHFITLTNAGIQLYRKIRPLDQLHRVLLISKGSELKQVLAPFVRCFGETEVCSMLLAIACGVQSDSIEAYSSVSSDMTPSLANGVIDEYLHSAAIQGIFDCGLGLAKVRKASTARKSSANENEQPSFIASSARVVLKSESEMSYYHDALILFLSRVMRPLWQNKDGKLSTDNSNNTWEMVYDINKLCEIREVLFQLRQLMENTGPFSVAVSSGAASLEASAVQKSLGKNAHGSEAGETNISRVSQLSERFAETRSDDQLKQEKRYRMEQQSLYFQYRFVCRSIEVISLLDVLDKYKSTPSENLLTFNFGDLVASTEGVEVARAAIRTLMQSNENEQNAQLIQHLRAQCPSFFSVPDLWQYQGYKSLSSAKLSTAPSAQRKYLQEALSQFLKSCHMWNSEDGIEVLRNTCEDLIALHFYDGVVRLSLACARNFSSETKFDKTPIHSPFVVATGVSTREKTRLLKQNCFGPILLALQKLLPSTTSSASDMATSHRNWYSKKKPKNQTTMNELVCLDEESRRRYVDEILHLALASEDEDLHILLYSWLMEHGHTRTLLSIRTPYIEPFLQSQNRDLLIQLYMEQQKYLLAANVWWELAREDHTENTFDVDSDMNGVFTEQAQGLRDHELKIVDRALLERNPDISKRQYYISKTLACLKNMEQSGLNENANSVDATREVLDIMDVLNLQARIFTSLNQSLTELEADVDFSVQENSAFTEEISRRRDDVTLLKYKMLSPTTLYNQFAVKYSMWAECLHIIRVCRSEESNTVEALWRKIIFDVIPRSSNDSQFNNWLAKMRQEARLTEISADVSTSFESGVWIGQVQCIVQRLGRILLNDDRRAAGDVGYTYTSNGMDRFLVFPVTFLLRELETLSSWYIRATQLSVSAATTLDIGAFNWVVRLFVDVGLPYQIILGNYEELYREQGNFSWGIHLMRSIKAAINMWRKHSIVSGDRNEELSNFATCIPHLVEFCDDILTDLQAVPPDAGCDDVFVLLDDYRDLKRQLINFRNIS